MTKCTICLARIDVDQFLRNDHVCNVCVDLPADQYYRSRSNTAEQQAAIAAATEEM